MPERRLPARIVMVDYLCDICESPLKATGVMLASSPPQYPHFCGHCGETVNLLHKYPRQEIVVASESFP